MGGTLAGTDSWFLNPASQVSAHYGAGLDGTLHQYVKLQDRSWANGILEPGNHWGDVCALARRPAYSTVNPNELTVSIETEDNGDPSQPVTDEQYAAVLAAGRLALAAYPSLVVLTGHATISPLSRANCPGTRWTGGRLQDLARALGLTCVL